MMETKERIENNSCRISLVGRSHRGQVELCWEVEKRREAGGVGRQELKPALVIKSGICLQTLHADEGRAGHTSRIKRGIVSFARRAGEHLQRHIPHRVSQLDTPPTRFNTGRGKPKRIAGVHHGQRDLPEYTPTIPSSC